jgi:hypothetical protein
VSSSAQQLAQPRFAIIGNLDNRRVSGFVEALARRGWPAPILLSHRELITDITPLAAVFAQKPSWRVLNPIADLRILFDKVAGSRRYAAAGIPVPEQLPELESIRSAAQLREAMVELRWPAVYVKLSCGSSASGLALYRHIPSRAVHERDMILTTVARTLEGRFNSLQLQRVEQRAAVDELLDWLIGEGAQIERAIVKAQLDRRPFDLRVLVIAGEATFCVVRQSRHPITNLHLGGTRGDLDALRQQIPPAVWDAAMRSCVRVFEQHQCLHVGVDLLFEAGLRGHRVIEANAFGDLLPGLRTGAGLSVYEWELEQLRGPAARA